MDVGYELYRLSDAAFVATSSARLAAPNEFEALAGPCFEALDGSWDDPIALPAPAPAPTPLATTTAAPLPVYTPTPLPDPEPVEPVRGGERQRAQAPRLDVLDEPEPIRARPSALRVAGIAVGAAGGCWCRWDGPW